MGLMFKCLLVRINSLWVAFKGDANTHLRLCYAIKCYVLCYQLTKFESKHKITYLVIGLFFSTYIMELIKESCDKALTQNNEPHIDQGCLW